MGRPFHVFVANRDDEISFFYASRLQIVTFKNCLSWWNWLPLKASWVLRLQWWQGRLLGRRSRIRRWFGLGGVAPIGAPSSGVSRKKWQSGPELWTDRSPCTGRSLGRLTTVGTWSKLQEIMSLQDRRMVYYEESESGDNRGRWMKVCKAGAAKMLVKFWEWWKMTNKILKISKI